MPLFSQSFLQSNSSLLLNATGYEPGQKAVNHIIQTPPVCLDQFTKLSASSYYCKVKRLRSTQLYRQPLYRACPAATSIYAKATKLPPPKHPTPFQPILLSTCQHRHIYFRVELCRGTLRTIHSQNTSRPRHHTRHQRQTRSIKRPPSARSITNPTKSCTTSHLPNNPSRSAKRKRKNSHRNPKNRDYVPVLLTESPNLLLLNERIQIRIQKPSRKKPKNPKSLNP